MPQRFPVRTDFGRTRRYRLVALIIRGLFRTYFGRRIVITGRENVPESGALIVAANHLSMLEPLLIGSFFPGTLFAMTKKELFGNRLVAWFMAGCNMFPVDRQSADRRALRTAIDILKNRGRLLIFVEGTRATTPGMRRAEPGVGFLVNHSDAQVLPVAAWGMDDATSPGRRLPRRVPLHVRFGAPVTITPGASLQETADRVGEAVAALLPAAYRGVYATDPQVTAATTG